MHITIWNDIATVHDGRNHNDTSELCSKKETRCNSTKHSKESVHAHIDKE